MSHENEHTTILLVEDDPLIRILGSEMLNEAGLQVLEAGNADEAVKHLHDHFQVSMLFSDIEMPGSMNGLELANFVSRSWPHIGVLLTSGRVRPSEPFCYPTRFLPKPWTQEALLQQIRQILAS